MSREFIPLSIGETRPDKDNHQSDETFLKFTIFLLF